MAANNLTSIIYNDGHWEHHALPSEKLLMPQADLNAEKKDKIMGDKSPKSTKKKSGQKAKAVAAKKKK